MRCDDVTRLWWSLVWRPMCGDLVDWPMELDMEQSWIDAAGHEECAIWLRSIGSFSCCPSPDECCRRKGAPRTPPKQLDMPSSWVSHYTAGELATESPFGPTLRS